MKHFPPISIFLDYTENFRILQVTLFRETFSQNIVVSSAKISGDLFCHRIKISKFHI